MAGDDDGATKVLDVAHHHKHTADGTVEDVDFEGLRVLYEQFKAEVRNYGHDW